MTPLPPALPSTPGDLLNNAAVPAPQGVLVLTDGRVFSGAVRELPGGYRVDRDGQFNMVPFEYVSVTAPTVREAYVKLRNSVPQHTVDSHVKLAEWCREQGLLAEARQEAGAALRQEPLRTDVRQLLKELELANNPEPVHQQLTDASVLSPDGFLKPCERAFQGVAPEAMVQYVRQVQPILMNKCANGACHGTTNNREFTLQMTRGLSQQSKLTEANLAEVLSQLSTDGKTVHPLLSKPREKTPAHTGVFVGSVGDRQWSVIAAWVQSVQRSGDEAQTTLVVAANHPPAAANIDPVDRTVATSDSGEPPLVPEAFLDQILKEERPDPFDPDRFNRRVHGRSAADLRSAAGSTQP
jgi:hypothetical protein